MTQDVTIRLRLDQGNLPQASTQAAQSLGKIGEAGQISARQTAAAMRTLPAQMTDVATQLAGGQNPLLILLQQGGQIKDQFGGIGPAIRGIGAALTPTVLGIGAVAAVVGSLGVAAYQGSQEAAKLRDTIALTGNAAGLTAGRLDALAVSVSASTGQTVGSAKDIALALAASGTVSAGAMESTTRAVARLADVTGKDGVEIAKDFADMSGGVAKWAGEHNKAWNFISAEQYKYISRLEDQGQAEKAMIETNKLLLASLETQRTQLGYIESAWDRVTKSISEAGRAMASWGKGDTIEDAIRKVTADLTRLRQSERNEAALKPGQLFDSVFGGKPVADQIREAEQLLAKLKESKATAEFSATAISGAAAGERAKIKVLMDDKAGAKAGPGYGAMGPLTFDEMYPAAKVGDILKTRDVNTEARAAELASYDAINKAMAESAAKEDALNRTRLVAQEEFLDSLREATRRSAIELITDERERGEALVRLDQEIADRRLAAKNLTPGALAEARSLNAQRAENEITKLSDKAGSSTYDDVRGALAAAFRDSNNPAKAFASALGNAIFTRVTAGLADALATAAVGRNGEGGFLGQLIGSVIGGGYSVDTTGISTNNTGTSLPTAGGMATGTNFVPRDMIALVHRGEAIVPAKYNHPQSGGGGRMEVHYHVPAGQSPAAYAAALADNNARLEAKFAADMARPGRRLNNAMLAGA